MSNFNISVILANFNHAQYISRCLEALLNQKFKPLEIIIIDDCSTDNSKIIINKFAKKYKYIRAFFNKKNLNTVSCQNIGLKIAKGNFVYFAASDDYILEDFFYEMYKIFLLNKNIHLIVGNAFIFDLFENKKIGIRPIVIPKINSGFITNLKFKKLLLNADHFILTGSSLIRISTIKSFGLLDERLESFADGFLTRIIALKYGFSF